MEKPLLTLKPNLVNALIPLYLKYTIYLAPLFILLYAVSVFRPELQYISSIGYLVLFLLLTALIPMIIHVIILGNTHYIFHRGYVIRNFKFIVIKRFSIPYSQIVNVKTDISLWDRICKSGDIILHSAENKAPDLVLHYIKDPLKIEKGLYNLVIKKQRK